MTRRKKGNIVRRRRGGRNTKKDIKLIFDTPKNVARALFSLKRKEKEESKS